MSLPTPSATMHSEKINRREFLCYVWTASTALLLAEAGINVAWFMSAKDPTRQEPHLAVDLAALRKAGNAPVYLHPKVWLCNTPRGFFAFHDFCTHLGCMVKWMTHNQRFECPCHGAKFQFDGTLIEGPAKRNLDSYAIKVTTLDGIRTTPRNGGPVDIQGTAIEVDLESPIIGQARR
jgi:cytochrome b6-f complex iron-sulfur subunit